ncbi:MAG TPA: type III-A CRISPR-associated protein Csm2 [bacterium]|nr:type III-A CRISPR-associated protein Csm2 [bacterium]HQG44201.1 type III-A CRISPR-associated protein Csm2 [bacterium]HQI47888.1 type III-A CRISPR-associated protein Csm2 [bacterium]HQJ66206.1 type III-A CRISPR-associated protein Csm2 [bacterium]
MQYQERNSGPSPVVEEILKIVKKNSAMSAFKGEDLVNCAEKFAKYLAKDVRLKTSQIRKFLDAVKKVQYQGLSTGEYDFRTEAMMMKPKLAYAAGRSMEVKPFMEVITLCIDRVRTREDFEQFAKFIEAIVAYHKYFGGREQ